MMFAMHDARSQGMPPAVALALLQYKQRLPAPTWERLRKAYTQARASYAPSLALTVAEKAVFGAS